jgi:hypothetical protein
MVRNPIKIFKVNVAISGIYRNLVPIQSLARLIFYLEDGGDTFLRNIGLRTGYKAAYPKIWQHP